MGCRGVRPGRGQARPLPQCSARAGASPAPTPVFGQGGGKPGPYPTTNACFAIETVQGRGRACPSLVGFLKCASRQRLSS
jgi:hypothetical protein